MLRGRVPIWGLLYKLTTSAATSTAYTLCWYVPVPSTLERRCDDSTTEYIHESSCGPEQIPGPSLARRAGRASDEACDSGVSENRR